MPCICLPPKGFKTTGSETGPISQIARTVLFRPAHKSGPVRRPRGRRARMKLPNELGPIHFIGIGGIGMSGIAEVLINLGYNVQGSDASDNANVKRLREQGAMVYVGHDADNLGTRPSSSSRPRSSATIRNSIAARARRIPVVRRAEMLAELMRLKQCVAIAGTHGKTTTTSLVATLLDAGGSRSDRHQRRHHQRLWHQCAARRRRLDGGRGRRERRHVPEAARRRRGRHQYRPGASRPLQDLRRDQGGVSTRSSRICPSTVSP